MQTSSSISNQFRKLITASLIKIIQKWGFVLCDLKNLTKC
jgi:hypothetical protein